jgi:hypothetical protein
LSRLSGVASRIGWQQLTPQTQALAHYLRARILWKLTDFSGAKEEFEQTLKKDPDGELGVRSRRALEIFQSPHR